MLLLTRIFRSCLQQQIRTYKKHTWDSGKPFGRSVLVKEFSSPNQAYFNLKHILSESRIRETQRYQQRFESNPQQRQRKRKEKDWRVYVARVNEKVASALHLKQQRTEQMREYRDL